MSASLTTLLCSALGGSLATGGTRRPGRRWARRWPTRSRRTSRSPRPRRPLAASTGRPSLPAPLRQPARSRVGPSSLHGTDTPHNRQRHRRAHRKPRSGLCSDWGRISRASPGRSTCGVGFQHACRLSGQPTGQRSLALPPCSGDIATSASGCRTGTSGRIALCRSHVWEPAGASSRHGGGERG